MGTTEEWQAYYDQQFGGDRTNVSRVAAGSQACVAWQIGAQFAGSDWKNATAFRNAMFSLNGSYESFYGPYQFDPAGRNIAKKFEVAQYQNGNLFLIRDYHNLIYPATWPWQNGDSTSSPDIALIVGVTVGSVACLLLICAVLLLIVALLIHWKFMVLFVPKHKHKQHAKDEPVEYL